MEYWSLWVCLNSLSSCPSGNLHWHEWNEQVKASSIIDLSVFRSVMEEATLDYWDAAFFVLWVVGTTIEMQPLHCSKGSGAHTICSWSSCLASWSVAVSCSENITLIRHHSHSKEGKAAVCQEHSASVARVTTASFPTYCGCGCGCHGCKNVCGAFGIDWQIGKGTSYYRNRMVTITWFLTILRTARHHFFYQRLNLDFSNTVFKWRCVAAWLYCMLMRN